MRNRVTPLAPILLAWLVICVGSGGYAGELTDDEVRARIIEESLAQYPGNCPCPESLDRAGHRCGGRSAYSKPGGAQPLCYPSDVTADMIKKWRSRNAA